MTTRITSEQLRGIFPALATPVTADGQIDTQAVRALLDHLQAQRGVYPLPGGRLQIRVEPTQLRDAQGNVVRTVG